MAEYEKVIHINPQEVNLMISSMGLPRCSITSWQKEITELMRTKYITFGIEAENIREARLAETGTYRVGYSGVSFPILGVSAYPLNGEERLIM